MPTLEMEQCTGCQHPIEDRFLLKVQDHFWHETCLLCAICRLPLSGSCFVKDQQLYCKHDYDKLFRGRCNGCGYNISSEELVMKALGSVYHLHCFRCIECQQILQRGDQFVIKDGQLFCRFDFDKEFSVLSYSPKDAMDDDSDSYEDMDTDNERHTKRPRTILTTSQRRKFKAAFEINPKPCRKIREQLAAEAGLTVRVVQVWFQNQRAKVKKMSRRQSPDSCGKDRKRKGKNSDIDQDRFPVQEGDESRKIFSNDIEGNVFPGVDGSNIFMDMPTSSDDSAGSPEQKSQDGAQDGMKNGCVTNHINKLYSMQTSYFCAE
ncbi:LIM/homeobox protein LMX-1.2-like isoform X2 [Argopecten irradians]